MRHTSTVINVKIALFEKIVLLLRRHVDVLYSLWLLRNLTLDGKLFLRYGKNATFVKVYHLSSLQTSLENVTLCVHTCRKPLLIG